MEAVNPLPSSLAAPLRGRRNLVLAWFATAALVALTMVAGFGALRFGGAARPSRSMPIMAAPEATPDVTAPVVQQLWEAKGGPDTPLDGPFGMAVDPRGNLWVADTNNNRFQIIAPDGTFRETWGKPGAGEGEFNLHPYDEFTGMPGGYGDVTFDRDGNMYVADTGNFRIQKFAPDRTFLRAWGSKGTGDGQFLAIFSVAVGPDGNIYVADENRNDVQRFDADGHFLNTIGEEGTGEGQLTDTESAAVDANGVVWITDYATGSILRFAPDGQYLGMWERPRFDGGGLLQPVDLAIDAMGRVWVVDIASANVQVYAPDGRFLTRFTRESTADHAGMFTGAIGIALSDDGRVYVSNWSGDFVSAFRILPGAGQE